MMIWSWIPNSYIKTRSLEFHYIREGLGQGTQRQIPGVHWPVRDLGHKKKKKKWRSDLRIHFMSASGFHMHMCAPGTDRPGESPAGTLAGQPYHAGIPWALSTALRAPYTFSTFLVDEQSSTGTLSLPCIHYGARASYIKPCSNLSRSVPRTATIKYYKLAIEDLPQTHSAELSHAFRSVQVF